MPPTFITLGTMAWHSPAGRASRSRPATCQSAPCSLSPPSAHDGAFHRRRSLHAPSAATSRSVRSSAKGLQILHRGLQIGDVAASEGVGADRIDRAPHRRRRDQRSALMPDLLQLDHDLPDSEIQPLAVPFSSASAPVARISPCRKSAAPSISPRARKPSAMRRPASSAAAVFHPGRRGTPTVTSRVPEVAVALHLARRAAADAWGGPGPRHLPPSSPPHPPTRRPARPR